jgi:uncharacterized protein
VARSEETITGDTVKLFVMGSLCVVVETRLGLKLFKKINEAAFRNIVPSLLIFSGGALVL